MQIHNCAPPTEAPNDAHATWYCPECGRMWEVRSPETKGTSSSESLWVPVGGSPTDGGPRSGWVGSDEQFRYER